jgi:hypothetical protein
VKTKPRKPEECVVCASLGRPCSRCANKRKRIRKVEAFPGEARLRGRWNFVVNGVSIGKLKGLIAQWRAMADDPRDGFGRAETLRECALQLERALK